MIIESIGTSLVVGKARGGKFAQLQEAQINKWYLIVAACLVEFSTVILASKGNSVLHQNMIYIHLTSYLLLFAGYFFNRDKLSFKVIFIGTFLNFLAIILNGGQMPVSAEAMLKAGLGADLNAIKNGEVVTHFVMNSKVILGFLGDIIAIPRPYPLPKVLSIGDFFIAGGVFIFIQEAMINKIKKHSKKA